MEFASKYPSTDAIKPAEVNQLLRDIIEGLRDQSEPVRVLDWGCGKGSLLLGLQNLGCDINGTELDERHVARLRETFGSDKIKLVAQNNRTDFDDDLFDLITVHHVFEHVQRPEELLAEIARLLKPGSVCISTFPAWGRFFEPHTKLPFAHYFPKHSVLRKFAIAFGVSIGAHATWVDCPPTKAERRALFAAYLNEKTNYKTIAEWSHLAEQAGLECRLVTHRTGAMRGIRKRHSWLPNSLFSIVHKVIQRFWIVHLELRPSSIDRHERAIE